MRSDAAEPTAVLPSLSSWERWVVGLILGLFFAVGLNAIHHLAFIGQDFNFHLTCTNRMFTHPDEWFAQDTTNRPLVYWIALWGMRVTANRAPFEFAAVVFLVSNAGGLWLLHDSMRRTIASAPLRIAALMFVAFLPATLIGAVAFSADAMAPPFFALLCWGLLRWTEAVSARAVWGHALLAGVALSIGNFAKFTFLALPVAVLVVGLALWRGRRINRAQFAPFLLCAVVMPGLVGGWLHLKAQRALADQPARHAFDWRGTGEMTWGSLLQLKPTDVRVFAAPGYWDFYERDGKQILPLLEPNGYSYPALLHLGVFTDVLDLANLGSTDRGAPRPQPQKRVSQWAVRTGLVFSLGAFVAVLVLTGRWVTGLGRRSLALQAGTAVWMPMGLAWFLPLVLTLPFVQHAYEWGYWLPRLIVPALWSFSFGLFSLVDEKVGRRKLWAVLILVVTCGQTWLHVRSVWY